MKSHHAFLRLLVGLRYACPTLPSRRHRVSKAEVGMKLLQVKLALARKYESLAKAARSAPKRKAWMHHAARFRRQAAALTRP